MRACIPDVPISACGISPGILAFSIRIRLVLSFIVSDTSFVRRRCDLYAADAFEKFETQHSPLPPDDSGEVDTEEGIENIMSSSLFFCTPRFCEAFALYFIYISIVLWQYWCIGILNTFFDLNSLFFFSHMKERETKTSISNAVYTTKWPLESLIRFENFIHSIL